jgi:murein peptide amidase A
VPDYTAVVDRLSQLPEHISLSILGKVANLPVYSATVNPAATESSLWINAGTHGDEPATVEAALLFLEEWPSEYLCNTRVTVTPCLNPSGFIECRRENADGIDINWAFSREDVPEIRIIKALISDQRYTAIVDLHEDWESPGYYLYEQIRDRMPLGHRITERVEEHCPVNTACEIEGERADRGVINPSMVVAKRRNGEGVPVEVFNLATDHQITSESPSGRPMDERVKAHLTAIAVFLEAYGVR